MNNVYLRIGADKAGTVSITSLASKNQSIFERFGVYSFPRNCVHFLELIRKRADADDIGPLKDPDKARRSMAEKFQADLERGEYCDKDILLVTETLWGRLSKRDLNAIRDQVLKFLFSVRKVFPDHDVKLILQVRRIDLYIESLLKQDIKAGRPTTLKSLQSRVTEERAFTFFRILEEVFGKENLIIRPFERSQLYNGCVVEDMLHTMGLSDHVGEFEITHGNEGLHRDLMETLIKMNQRYGKVTNNKELLRISSRLGKEFSYEDVKSILSKKARQELIEQYAAFYEYLAKFYGDGNSFFKDPLPDDSHLTYRLDPKREALIEELVLEQADSPISVAAKS